MMAITPKKWGDTQIISTPGAIQVVYAITMYSVILHPSP